MLQRQVPHVAPGTGERASRFLSGRLDLTLTRYYHSSSAVEQKGSPQQMESFRLHIKQQQNCNLHDWLNIDLFQNSIREHNKIVMEQAL